jgi:hypothetical protein
MLLWRVHRGVWYTYSMTPHQEFLRWLRDAATTSASYDPVTRTYPNSAGADELITLHRNYWDYVDWLEARGDIRFADWVIHCEQNAEDDAPLSETLMYWLWKDECNRWLYCAPTPSKTLPAGFSFWKARYGDRVWTVGCGRL